MYLSQLISHRGMDKHLQSQSHINRFMPKVIDGVSQVKSNNYNTF